MAEDTWTELRIECLRALWNDGLSASQIAEHMPGLTRNQVIGKAHRLGLASRPSPIKRESAPGVIPLKAAPKRGPMSPPPLPRAAIPVRAEAPKPMPAALVEGQGRWRPLIEAGPRDCRWPRGDLLEGSLCFCCAPTEPGHSYCGEHETAARGRGLASLERYDPEAKAA